jgi:hypothetical protein
MVALPAESGYRLPNGGAAAFGSQNILGEFKKVVAIGADTLIITGSLAEARAHSAL